MVSGLVQVRLRYLPEGGITPDYEESLILMLPPGQALALSADLQPLAQVLPASGFDT